MTDEDWNTAYSEHVKLLVSLHPSTDNEMAYVPVNAGIVDWIVEHLTEAKRQYYLTDSEYMSDKMYDKLEHFLKVHDANHPFLSKVGTDV